MNDTYSAEAQKDNLENLLGAVRNLERTVANVARTLGAATSAQASTAGDAGPALPPVTAGLALTASQRRICERVINVFETGTPEGKYGAISIYRDGPNRIRQITYGRSQTTEYGNLDELVRMYANRNGRFSQDLRPYVDMVGVTALVDDETFKNLLRRAGNEDPVMRETQDIFFDQTYFQPAQRWASDNGFTQALSMLVIYDSFIHSGRILRHLRSRFPERPPALGGNEKVWIQQYVDARHYWLTNNDNPAVRPSNYRTRDLAREIARGNWDLSSVPFVANGVPVFEGVQQPVGGAAAGPAATVEEVPYLRDGGEAAFGGEVPESYSEVELVEPVVAAADSTAELASRILASSSIKLATAHVSGVDDRATARLNIEATAAGAPAQRSSYGTAPGGSVALDPRMLRGLLALAATYTFTVSELAGGNHSANSRHYAGVAVDIATINGQRVGADHPTYRAFMTACRDLGATEVLGPGNAGHSTHIHAAWPRPA